MSYFWLEPEKDSLASHLDCETSKIVLSSLLGVEALGVQLQELSRARVRSEELRCPQHVRSINLRWAPPFQNVENLLQTPELTSNREKLNRGVSKPGGFPTFFE